MFLTEINIYPIKSLGGISLNEAKVLPRGLEHDRRWLLVDKNNQFLTQRAIPEMALLSVSLKEKSLEVRHKIHQNKFIEISFQPTDKKIKVQIWDDQCDALELENPINQWFSEILSFNCKLVYMPDSSKRKVDPNFAKNQEIVSFADGYPFLILSEESLNHLNKKLKEKLPMNRFRPNFVFSGGTPHIEDTFKNFSIGNVNFKGVKPCARCSITTTNQATAERKAEPLKTLSTYRKKDNKIFFGQNLLLMQENGFVKLGDEIVL